MKPAEPIKTVDKNLDLNNALLKAQSKAWQLIKEIEQRKIIAIGVTEKEATEKIYDLAFELFGTKKHWHKRIVRTGINTVYSYKVDPENLTIQENDLVYLDLGPVFDEYEGDVGKTYLLGKDARKEKLLADLERVFTEAKAFYLSKPDMTGAELHAKVIQLTEEGGWTFGNYHAGHIVGEFSHSQRHGDLPEHRISPLNLVPMNSPAKDGSKRHWIPEIHIVDLKNQYGGFFEDLLTL